MLDCSLLCKFKGLGFINEAVLEKLSADSLIKINRNNSFFIFNEKF